MPPSIAMHSNARWKNTHKNIQHKSKRCSRFGNKSGQKNQEKETANSNLHFQVYDPRIRPAGQNSTGNIFSSSIFIMMIILTKYQETHHQALNKTSWNYCIQIFIFVVQLLWSLFISCWAISLFLLHLHSEQYEDMTCQQRTLSTMQRK